MPAVATATEARPQGDLERRSLQGEPERRPLQGEPERRPLQGEPARLFELGGPGLEGGPTLEEVVLRARAELDAGGEAECMVCGGRMPLPAGEACGCCEECGSELS